MVGFGYFKGSDSAVTIPYARYRGSCGLGGRCWCAFGSRGSGAQLAEPAAGQQAAGLVDRCLMDGCVVERSGAHHPREGTGSFPLQQESSEGSKFSY